MLTGTLPYRFFPLCFVGVRGGHGRREGFPSDARRGREERTGATSATDEDNGDAAPDMGAMEPRPRHHYGRSTRWWFLGRSSGDARWGDPRWKKSREGLGHVGRVTVMQASAKGDSVLALLWVLPWVRAALLTLAEDPGFGHGHGHSSRRHEGGHQPIIVLALAWALGGIIQSTDRHHPAGHVGGLPAWALPASTSILSYVSPSRPVPVSGRWASCFPDRPRPGARRAISAC